MLLAEKLADPVYGRSAEHHYHYGYRDCDCQHGLLLAFVAPGPHRRSFSVSGEVYPKWGIAVKRLSAIFSK
jgi:hypothetical protein